ncbi:hypothetical protein HG536_0C04960 [Torulaspora globosa]|uniref:Uncharacterized protein n=1 Tax=Torulaspora globosa TaxID=48254 RepID=A0A7G3ZFP1_9SACH|nr:uncharacterized protein HG536_0C04960 [Torulaspora globosa]QLL32327.1 hypothetical protein HG536_0C04960 [Torulaspora globosa]
MSTWAGLFQGLVTERKTRTARFIDFYPIAGDYDPIMALDCLLKTTEPQKKAVITSFTATQEYLVLRKVGMHRRRRIPSYLNAFLSGYYELVKVENTSNKVNYTCKLINPTCRPPAVKKRSKAGEVLESVYHGWKAIVKPEVLSFILRYSEAMRQLGPLEAEMLSKSTVDGPSPPLHRCKGDHDSSDPNE